ncbi:MAG: cytochrome c1, partial [Pseudomonadota bacterium]
MATWAKGAMALAISGCLAFLGFSAAQAAGDKATAALYPEDLQWSFEGPFGMYDRAAVQRGYKVYREICASCHAMEFLSFRNLGQKGGPFYSSDYPNPNDNPYVKAIVAKFVRAIDDEELGG